MANVSKLNINNTEYDIKDSVARASIPSLPLSTANGGTGNSDGYIRTGQKSGTTIGTGATAEGSDNTASGNYAHAEGNNTTASYNYAHAEGKDTQASSTGSHAEGISTKATGSYSHAEGSNTVTSNSSSHAEGSYTTASGNSSHAEGNGTKATSFCSHAEGGGSYASATYSHAEGAFTTASGNYSHAGGYKTIAGYENQTAVGQHNDNKSTTLFEVGNGTFSARSNAFEVHSNGNATVYGDLSVSGTVTGNAVETNPTSDSSKLVTSGGVATALAGKVDDTGDTISGTLILSKNTDASGIADNRPALIVGGQPSAAHIEIDGNEVIAKASATTTATLYLNSDGGGVAVGSGGSLSVTRNTSAIYVTSAHTVSNTSYNDGPIVVFNNSASSGTAAGIGFHNTGSNGVYLHLPRGSSGNHLVVRNHNSTATSTVAFTSDIPTVGTAAAKGYTDSSSASAIGTGTSLTTERDVYYGLPKINNSHTYNSNSSFYAPTSAGTSGYFLKSNGSGAPTWAAVPSGGATKSYIYYNPNDGSPEARDSIKAFSILTHSSSAISTIPALITYISANGFTPMRYAVGTRINGIGSGVGASIIELLGTNNSGNKIILKQDLTAGGSSMPFDDNAFDINNNGCGVINYFFLGSPEATLSDSVTNWGTGVYLHKFTINFRTFSAYQSNGGSNTSGSTYLIGGTVKWF